MVNYEYFKTREDFLFFVERMTKEKMVMGPYSYDLTDELSFDKVFELIGADKNKLMQAHDKAIEQDREDEFCAGEMDNILDYQPFEIEPKSYPAICIWHFEKSFDRCGNFSVEIFDIIPLEEMRGY